MYMKKFALILCLVSFTCGASLFAHQSDVELTDIHDRDLSMGHDCEIPTVRHDGDDIVIKCDSTIYNVDIIIRDQYGMVMYQSTMSLSPTETLFYVPDTGNDREKTTIDLYYDKKHLVGYFEK